MNCIARAIDQFNVHSRAHRGRHIGHAKPMGYNPRIIASEVSPMGTVSLEAKKAYAARTRRSNYAASLRLEGFKVTFSDGECKMPTREEVLKSFTKTRT